MISSTSLVAEYLETGYGETGYIGELVSWCPGMHGLSYTIEPIPWSIPLAITGQPCSSYRALLNKALFRQQVKMYFFVSYSHYHVS